MVYLLSLLWLALCAAWISGVFFLASTVGGMQWLVHTGMGVPAGMNILMAALCLLAAVSLLTLKRVPFALMVAAAAGTSLHLINAFGMYLMYESNGRILTTNPIVAKPFLWLGTLLPTNTVFTELLTGNHVFLILPFGCLALVAATAWRKSKNNMPVVAKDDV
jgi:hypothetical protein